MKTRVNGNTPVCEEHAGRQFIQHVSSMWVYAGRDVKNVLMCFYKRFSIQTGTQTKHSSRSEDVSQNIFKLFSLIMDAFPPSLSEIQFKKYISSPKLSFVIGVFHHFLF